MRGLVPRIPLRGHRANLIEMAGTSPAMTWIGWRKPTESALAGTHTSAIAMREIRLSQVLQVKDDDGDLIIGAGRDGIPYERVYEP